MSEHLTPADSPEEEPQALNPPLITEDALAALTDDDVALLEMERDTMKTSFVDIGRADMEAALVRAIAVMIDLAEGGHTPTVQFNAAKYIIDRNLGPVTAGSSGDAVKSEHEKLLDDITTTIPLDTPAEAKVSASAPTSATPASHDATPTPAPATTKETGNGKSS